MLNILENKKPANNAEKNTLLALVVVLNILENKKPANPAEKKKHFVSASFRAQHPTYWALTTY